MRPGVHVSISGGLNKAIARASNLGCLSMQIFTSSPRGWKQRQITNDEAVGFRSAFKESGIGSALAHTPYLVNLSTSNTELWDKSVESVTQTIANAGKLGLQYVVTHVGGDSSIPLDLRIQNLSAAIFEIFKRSTIYGDDAPLLLLENSAGSSGSTLSKLEQFAAIFNLTDELPLGCCLDTCHLFAAGYDISSTEKTRYFLKTADSIIGLNRIKAFHLNDAKGDLGSMLDRHEHIGKGKIGLDAFKLLMRNQLFTEIPGILETPKKTPEDDINNMMILKELAGQLFSG